MIRCPVCVKTKLKLQNKRLICPDCGYEKPGADILVDAKEIPIVAGKMEFELKCDDKLFLNKESFIPNTGGSTTVENLEKLICEEYPFIGSLVTKKYIIEIEYKVKAVNLQE